MKTRITRPIHQFQQAKSENLNENLTNILEEYNGGLDGQNMPVETLTVDHLNSPSTDSLSGVYSNFVSMNGVVQDYHQVSNWNVAEGGTDVWTPRGTHDLSLSDWSRGWNSLTIVDNFDDTKLSIDTVDGMLVGCVVVDFHHGVDRVRTEGGFTIFSGYQWWSEWGVFVNGTLVAQTGYIYPRRATIQLPFKVPVGSKKAEIEVKWKTITGLEDTSFYLDIPDTDLDVFGCTIWAREVRR